MSDTETPTVAPSRDRSPQRDRLVGAIVACTVAIIATVVVTGVVVVDQVGDTVDEQAQLTRDETWSAVGGTDSALSSIMAELTEAREAALQKEKAAARRAPAPSTALTPGRVAPRRADLGEAVNLGDVRVAAGWQLRTVEPATAMTDASMQLEGVRVSLTQAGTALSSVSFELRDAHGTVVGTGWCYAPTDEGADTQPKVWCQPFAVTGKPVTARVGSEIRS
jgi:hypothetical protein